MSALSVARPPTTRTLDEALGLRSPLDLRGRCFDGAPSTARLPARFDPPQRGRPVHSMFRLCSCSTSAAHPSSSLSGLHRERPTTPFTSSSSSGLDLGHRRCPPGLCLKIHRYRSPYRLHREGRRRRSEKQWQRAHGWMRRTCGVAGVVAGADWEHGAGVTSAINHMRDRVEDLILNSSWSRFEHNLLQPIVLVFFCRPNPTNGDGCLTIDPDRILVAVRRAGAVYLFN